MSPRWSRPPEKLRLLRDRVHIWRASLEMRPSELERLRGTLDSGEAARAARLVFEKDRQHFVAARGILRNILGRYLEREPAELQFSSNSSGKPALAPGSGLDELRFNLSHSHGLALYAISWNREVGIDIELIQPQLAEERIAERFFSPREVAALRALPRELQAEGFFNCWTRKEAYIKARGQGLGIPLASFDVSLAPGEPPTLLSVRDSMEDGTRWSLQAFEAAPGFPAAVAAEGESRQLEFWQWELLPQ